MALLRAAGFDAPTALRVLATVHSYVIGFAFWEAGTAPFRAGRAAPLPEGADPYLVELIPQVATTSCDESFEFGLGLMIAGLERRAAS